MRIAFALLIALRPPVELAAKPWSADVEAGSPWIETQPLRLSAAPGESEPATFVVRARRGLRRLAVRVSDLRSRSGTIPGAAVSIRDATRSPFVPVFQPVALPAGDRAEVWLDVAVPPDVAPGLYTGQVVLDADGREVVRTLALRVRDLRLQTPWGKGLGIYYRMFGALGRPETVSRDLADMRAHGVEHVVTDLRPTFRIVAGSIAIDMGHVARGLDLLADAGMRGTVVVDSGLVQLARALGHPIPFVNPRGGTSLRGEGGAAFREQAATTMRLLRAELLRHPELDVAVSHLDEVFRPERLELFIALASAAREVDVPIYATLSTSNPLEDRWRRQIDPLVDIRAQHGFTFEWWLARGNTWEDYARELERSGDQAWCYHNDRGPWFDARWTRIVNGVFLWFGPFSVHSPWVYRSPEYAVAQVDPDDARVVIPTRNWMAVREGYDDLRYLETLRRALAAYGPNAPEVAARSRAFLQALRVDVLRVPPDIDAEGLPSKVGTAAEAPLLGALARRYDTADLDLLRDRVEEQVVSLRIAAGDLASR